MPVLITCQRCGGQSTAPDSSAGGQVSCPHCSWVNNVAEAVMPASVARPPLPTGPPQQFVNWDPRVQRPLTQVQPVQPTPQRPAPRQPPAIVAAQDRDSKWRSPWRLLTSRTFVIVFLSISALSAFALCVSWFGIATSGSVLFLGAVGFVVATSRRGASIAFAIVGGLVRGLAVISKAIITSNSFKLLLRRGLLVGVVAYGSVWLFQQVAKHIERTEGAERDRLARMTPEERAAEAAARTAKAIVPEKIAVQDAAQRAPLMQQKEAAADHASKLATRQQADPHLPQVVPKENEPGSDRTIVALQGARDIVRVYLQGKRTLTVIPEKHLRQVVFAPTAAATTHCDA